MRKKISLKPLNGIWSKNLITFAIQLYDTKIYALIKIKITKKNYIVILFI